MIDLLPKKNGQGYAPKSPGWVAKALAGISKDSHNRNETFASIVGKLHREHWSQEDIATLLSPHADKCGFEPGELGKIIDSITSYPNQRPNPPNGTETQPQDRKNQATKLVGLASEFELFHDGDECFATLAVNNHRENWPLRSGAFKRCLNHQFFNREGKTAGASAMQEAIDTLEGRAQFGGSECRVYTRLAEFNDAIYLDLVNDDWQAVEITNQGWQVVSNPPVKFRRARGMLPLPTPLSGGSIKDLRPFVNTTPDGWYLVVAWLVASLRPRGPYPVLTLNGEQGSAKSTLARICRRLTDPNSAPLRSEPRDARDLMIAATNGWVVAIDNLSHLQPWLSDLLCRLSTGGGFGTRQLYSDNEEKLFEAQRPIILNGIEELTTRGDLLDRAIVECLPTIPPEKRQPEKTFWKNYEAVEPQILGALLSAVSRALREYPTVRLDQSPRMADFAHWITAAEPALGWEPGSFLTAYTGNREEANELTLDASPITTPLKNLLETGAWEGTATELLNALGGLVDDATRNQKTWPKTATAVSNALRRIAPNLRAIGLEVAFQRGRLGRLIKLERKENSASSPSSASSVDAVDTYDGKIPNDSNCRESNIDDFFERAEPLEPDVPESEGGA
jgi:hypothetical protein